MTNKNSKLILCTAIIGLLFSISMIAGCKKEEDSSITETCTDGIQNQNETGVDCGGSCNACTASAFRIKTIITDDGNSFYATETFTYDNRGRIVTLISTGSIAGSPLSFTYHGTDSITETRNDGWIYAYALDSNGYALTQIVKDSTGATLFSSYFYYDSEGHLETDVSSQGVIYNTWTDSNLSIRNSGYGLEYYSYYTDKANTIGYENKGFSFLGKDSKNLVSKSTYGNDSTTYTYEYDSQNRVTKQIGTRVSSVFEYTYTYY